MVAFQDESGQWHEVSKQSAKKTNLGGKKNAVRAHDGGVANAELISSASTELGQGDRSLLVDLVIQGEIQDGLIGEVGVESARAHHSKVKAQLPASAHRLTKGEPAIPTKFV
jgi:nicotinate phosphoribosyltransferase